MFDAVTRISVFIASGAIYTKILLHFPIAYSDRVGFLNAHFLLVIVVPGNFQ